MYLLLLCGPVALGVAVAHAFVLRRWTFWVALGLALFAALVGGLGTVTGLLSSFGAVSGADIDPTTKAKVLAGGISEAMNCCWSGAMIAGAAAVPLVIGEVRRYRRKRRAAAGAAGS
jgi:hypothetical protein